MDGDSTEDDPWDFGTAQQYPALWVDFDSDGDVDADDIDPQRQVAFTICYRTPQVRDEIVAVVSGVSTCGDVTQAHLAAITSLDLQRKSITLLKSGDFVGLTSLSSLDLVSNQLTTLPDGVFNELPALIYLGLSVHRLTTLPAGFLTN